MSGKVVSLARYRTQRRRGDEPTVITRLPGRAKHLGRRTHDERRELAERAVEGDETETETT